MRTLLIMAYVLIPMLTFGKDSLTVQASSSMEAFFMGNEAYKNEQFTQAIDLYRSVLNEDKESWELYYNLGNAYFKTGDIPMAILHFEKARKLNPENEDLKANLEMANTKTVDKIESKPELPVTAWWNSLLNAYTIDQWGKISIYLSFFGLSILILYLFTTGMVKRISFFIAAFFFAVSLLFFALGHQQRSLQTDQKFAIIFSPSVTVKSAPEDDGTRLFVIHEGTKIEVIKDEGGWSQVSLMNGNKGWVKTDVYVGI